MTNVSIPAGGWPLKHSKDGIDSVRGFGAILPFLDSVTIRFTQSAVFTPAEFAFPNNGIKAEATPNTEMTLIVDVDLDLLRELHSHGSVRNLKDRRLDVFELRMK
jgi:hypothetical protein